MWGRRRAWNPLACQNPGMSAVHLDRRPDIIAPHHLAATQKHASFIAAVSFMESGARGPPFQGRFCRRGRKMWF